jgi:ABC-2 type transport system permease protein
MPQLAADKIRKQTEEELFGPSRLQEEAPHFARSVGIFGLFVLLASAVMAGWNAIRLIIGGESSQLPFFGRGWINFWITAGSAMLYFHAAFDRALEIRRSYMTLAWLALVSGALAGLIWVIHGLWGTVAAIVVSILAGLMTLAVTVSPWVMASDQGSESNQVDGGEQVRETVNDSTAEAASPSAPPVNWFFSRLSQLGSFLVRWNSLIGTDVAVTRITFAAAVLIALAIIVPALLVVRFQWSALPSVSLLSMLAGTVFLITAAKHEREWTWRQAAAYLLALVNFGATVVLLGFVIRDLVQTNDPGIVAPAGLVAGLLGLVFFLGQVNLSGTDDDLSYYAAIVCLCLTGALVAVLSIIRSSLPPLSVYLSDTWRPSPYFIPNGLLLVILSVLQIITGLVTVSNNQLVAIFRRELLAYFYTPAAYLVLAAIALLAAFQYLVWMSILLAGASDPGLRDVFTEPVIRWYFYQILPVFALLAIPPFVTMRLFSEEKRTGTLEVLLAAPVSETTVVLGKFLGAWAFFLVAWGMWFVFPLIFRFLMGQPFDYNPMLSFYVGTGFMALSFIAIGAFFSALTENQVIAAVLSYAGVFAMFFPQLLHWIFTSVRGGAGGWIANVIREIAILQQYDNFLEGRMYLQHLLYHVSIAVLFVFLTVRILESRKWK